MQMTRLTSCDGTRPRIFWHRPSFSSPLHKSRQSQRVPSKSLAGQIFFIGRTYFKNPPPGVIYRNLLGGPINKFPTRKFIIGPHCYLARPPKSHGRDSKSPHYCFASSHQISIHLWHHNRRAYMSGSGCSPIWSWSSSPQQASLLSSAASATVNTAHRCVPP